MANAVFTAQIKPSYDDLPEVRYHFPGTYLRQAKQAEGDWVVYYEPRRESPLDTRAKGRKSYFAIAKVESIVSDPDLEDHYYAHISNYLEFPNPVPFKEGGHYYESRLQKDDGSTNKGQFGRNVREIPANEFQLICKRGFAGESTPALNKQAAKILAESPVPFGRSTRTQILERPFRDATFSRVIRRAYGHTCAMTGLSLVNTEGKFEVEAAHIRPVEDDGPDSPRNGISLSRTVHWLFDSGILGIADNGEILMAKKLLPERVRKLLNPDGHISVPASQIWAPHPVFLHYHRENKFKG